MANARSILQILLTAKDDASKVFKDVSKSLKKAGVDNEELSRQARTTGLVLTGLASVAGVAAVKSFASFEKAMSNVKAITGATGKEFTELTKLAKEMGKTTVFTADEAAEAMKFLGMAGFTTAEVMQALPDTLNLASAAALDLGTTADIVSNVLRGMGGTAEETQRFVDVLAKTVTSSNTNMISLGEAMKFAAPLAKQLGTDVTEAAAAIGILANAGIKGTLAGTGLQTLMKRLANDTGGARTELENLGVEVFNEAGKFAGLSNIIEGAREVMETMSQEQRTQLASTIAGSIGMKSFLTLVDSGEDALANYTKELENSEGAAQKMADIQLDNLAGGFELLQSAISGARIELGKEFAPILLNVTSKLTKSISEINATSAKNVIVFTLISGAVLILAGSLLKIIKIFKAVRIVVIAINKALLKNSTSLKAVRLSAKKTAVGMKLFSKQLSFAAIRIKAATLAANLLNIAIAPLLGLAIVLTVAIIGFAKVMSSIKALKKENIGLQQSIADRADMTKKASLRIKEELKSENSEVVKLARLKQEQLVILNNEGVNDRTRKLQTEIQSQKRVLEELGIINKETTEKITSDWDGSDDNIKDAGDSIEETIKKVSDKYSEMSNTIVDVSDEINQAVKEVAVSIGDINKSIEEVNLDNISKNLSINKQFAEAFVDQEQKVADIQGQFNSEKDSKAKNLLRDKLDFETSELSRFKTISISLSNEVAEVRRINGLSDIARTVENLNKERTLENQEAENKIKQLNVELKNEEEKYNILKQLQEAALVETDRILAQEEQLTLDSINRTIEMYNQLAKAKDAVASGQTSGFVESTGLQQRLDQVSPVVNIEIKDNSFVGEGGAEEFINDSLMPILQANLKAS